MRAIKKISFIIHGKIRRCLKLQKEIEAIFFPDFVLDFKVTTQSINAIDLSIEALKESTDFLVAVGGDGTVNEVVNGYLQFQTTKIIPLGVIPLGRGNDLVKSLGIKNDLKLLYRSLSNSEFKNLDVGKLSFFDFPQKNLKSRYFINIADIGLGGLATQMVRTSPRFLGANWTYFWSILRSLWMYTAQDVVLSCSDWKYSGKIISICMANGRFFASGLAIAPSALLDDGKAEIVIVGKVGWLDFLRHLPQLRRGEKLQHREIKYLSASACQIDSLIPMPIDIDGEFVGYTPLSMKMLPQRIKIIVPRG